MTFLGVAPRLRKPTSLRPVEVSPLAIRQEARADAACREALLDAAFGAARFTKTSERLRDGRKPARGLALSATLDGEFAGTLRLWNINAGGVDALLLGPLAVGVAHRSLGIGAALMRAGLRQAKLRGHTAVLLVGDPLYYARFGFSSALTSALDLPGPVERQRLLALELAPGALAQASGSVLPSGDWARRLGQAA